MSKYAELMRRSADEHEAAFAESDLARELRAAADEIEKARPVYQARNQITSPWRWWDTTKEDAEKLVAEMPDIYEHRVLYTAPLVSTDEWKAAIDHELVMIGTTSGTFDSPEEAITALLDWHVQVALDPAVSSKAASLHEETEQLRTALEDGQLEAIVVAYQMGYEKGLIGARRKNPYGTSWSCDKAWDNGYDEGCIASGRLDDGTL